MFLILRQSNHHLETELVRRVGWVLLVLFASLAPLFLFPQSALATVETFTTTGANSWTAPTDVYSVTVECWGGGGGGGKGDSGSSGAGGGAGGGYAKTTVNVTPGNSYSYTVGTGGSGASGGSSDGGAGSDSTFETTLCVGAGGAGGLSATAGSGAGGATTTGSTGDVTYDGGRGADGDGSGGGGAGSSAAPGGDGTSGVGQTGGTALTDGGDGGGGGVGTNQAGSPGTQPGGGGGGGSVQSGGAEAGGAGAAGQIRLTYETGMSVSGTLYDAPGGSAITSSKTIKLAIGTSTLSVQSTTTDASGNFSFDVAVTNIGNGTPYVIWVDGDAVRATVVGKFNGPGVVADADLYQNYVIARHEATATSTTFADFDTYDSGNDPDILYTAAADSLTLLATSTLYIWSGDTLKPNGHVTLPGGFVAAATAKYSPHASGTTFIATSTGFSITVASTTNFGSTTFNGSGGGWTMTDNITVSDLTLLAGTLTAPAGTLTIQGDYTNSGGTFTNNGGTVAMALGIIKNYVAGRDTDGSDTGTTNFLNFESFAVSGNYLFVGSVNLATACSQTAGSATGCELKVFDISDPTNPTYVAGRDADGSSAGTGAVILNSLAVIGNYLYAGYGSNATACSQTAGSAIGCELKVFDVVDATDPTYLQGLDVSGSETGVGAESINALLISDTYLFAGSGGDPTACSQTAGSAIGCELKVYWDGVTSHELTGAMIGESAFNTFTLSVSARFNDIASTSAFTVNSGTSVTAPEKLTIAGDYTNNGTVDFQASSTHVFFATSSAQSVSGTLTSSSSFASVTMSGGGTTTFASDVRFTGDYTNVDDVVTHGGDTVTFDHDADATLTGSMVGDSTFPDLVFSGTATTTFASSASSSDLTINSGATVKAPSGSLTVGGNFANNGTYLNNAGTLAITGAELLTSTSSVVATGGVGDFNSMQLDANSYPVIAYHDWSSNELKLMHCNDVACTGDDESVVTLASGSYSLSLQLDANGYPVIAYQNSSNDLRLIHCNDANCTGGDESDELVDTTSGAGDTISLQLDANGYPVIAYHIAGTSLELWLVHCNDVNCAGSNESMELLDASPGAYPTPSLQLDANGYPVIAYDGSSNLTLIRCNDANCTGSNETTVAFSGTGPEAVSLQLDSSDRPVISFVNFNDELALVQCTDTACASYVQSSVDTSGVEYAGFPAFNTSLQLDTLDRPSISYYSTSTGEVRFVRCNDSACADGNETPVVLDIAPYDVDGLGGWNSLQLDSAGLPVISYFATTTGLRLARCEATDCVEVTSQSLSGTLTATSALNHVTLTGDRAKTFSANASTTNFTVSGASTTAPEKLTVAGDYTNSGTVDFVSSSTQLFFATSGTQTIAGTLTGSSSLPTVTMYGGGTTTFSDVVTFTSDYTNVENVITHNGSTVTFDHDTDATLTGSMVGSSAFSDLVFSGTATTTLAGSASSSGFTVNSGATVRGPAGALSIAGDYTNNGTVDLTTNSTNVTFNGASLQTATGTMTGTSTFVDLTITNISGNGTTSRSLTFGAAASSTGTTTLLASTSVAFAANATSSFVNVVWDGTSTTTGPVWIYSSATSSAAAVIVTGNTTIEDVYLRDVSACGSTGGGLTATNSVNVANNTCWTFASGAAEGGGGGATAATWNATDWTLYDTITIDATQVDDDLTDFPVYVDLADLSSAFWATTPSASTTVGTDIRVTTNDPSPTELPRELVAASSTAQTGELHFKADAISSTTNTVFRIYYNGTTTGDYATDATYGAENVWTNDFLGVWHLNEDGNTTAGGYRDSTSFGHHGTGTSMTAASDVTGKLGQSQDFDGAADNIKVPQTTNLEPTAQINYSAWVKRDGAQVNYAMPFWYGANDAAPWGVYGFASAATSDSNYGVYVSSASTQYKVEGNIFDDGVWSHLVGQYDGSVLWAYQDGVNTGSSSFSITIADYDTVGLAIGNKTLGGQAFDGVVDELRIASTSRSAAWISAEYTNQSTTTDFYTAAPPTFSGTLYQDGGVTAAGSGEVVAVVIGTSTPTIHRATTTASGVWALNVATSNITSTTSITAYLDASTTEATTVVMGSGATAGVSDFDLWGNTLILRGATTSDTLTIQSIANYDSDDDVDILFTASSTATTTFSRNTYFTQGTIANTGTVDITNDLTNQATVSNTGTFVFSGTSKTLTAKSGASAVPAIGDVEVTGSLTVSGNATTSNLTIKAGGSLTAPATTLEVDGVLTQNGSFTESGGTLVLSGNGRDDVSLARYLGESFDVSNEDSAPRDLVFNDDGTKLYIVFDGGNRLYEYDLTTPYEVTTASYNSVFLALADANPQDVVFNNDGSKLFMVGFSGDNIYAYDLSTPYDISTATYNGESTSSCNQVQPSGLHFNSDGTKVFVAGFSGDIVYACELESAFDLSTSTYNGELKGLAEVSSLSGMTFNEEGTKMYVTDNSGKAVYTYDLSTAYDVSTASYNGEFYDVSSEETAGPEGVVFAPGMGKFFTVGQTVETVHAYELAAEHTGALTGSDALGVVEVADGVQYLIDQASSTDLTVETGALLRAPSTTLSVGGNFSTTGTFEHNDGGVVLSGTSKDITSVSAFNSLTVRGSVTAKGSVDTTNLTITSGGTFVAPTTTLSVAGNLVNTGTFTEAGGTLQFTGQARDIAEATFSASFNAVAPAEGVVFKPDGTKFFTVGQNDIVYAYDLSTAWDITSATYNSESYNVGGDEATPMDLTLNDDGTKLYVIGLSADTVFTYSLSTPYDLGSVATTSESLFVQGQDGAPRGIEFNTDGSKLFIAGFSTDRVYAYDLSTPYDVSSATYNSENVLVTSQLPQPGDVAFSPDGLRMLVIGDTSDAIFEYDLADPFDLSTTTYNGVTYSVANEQTSPQGMDFSDDGTMLFVAGRTGDDVAAYQLASGQSVSGTLTGTSALGDLTVATGSVPVTFTAAASTTNLTVQSSGQFTTGSTLSIAGNYTNDGTFTASTSRVVFSGSAQQTATGTLSGTSQFNDLVIANTSGNGTTSRSVVFAAPVTTNGTFTMQASTSAEFAAGATSTLATLDLAGTSSTTRVWLRSTATGTPWLLSTAAGQIVNYANVRDADATPTSGGIIASQSYDAGNNTNWTFADLTLTLGEHTQGQVDDAFTKRSVTDGVFFRFKLSSNLMVTSTISTLVIDLTGIQGVKEGDVSGVTLYRDADNDGTVSGGDVAVGGTGAVSISDQTGTLTFSESFDIATATDYLLEADITQIGPYDALIVSLTTTDITTGTDLAGSVSSVQHIRHGGSGGGGGSTESIGGGAPAGREVVTGGGETGGGEVGGGADDANIASNPNFFAPTNNGTTFNQWTNGANAYASDATDATANSSALRHSYGGFGFSIPGSNEITGIEVKVDAADSGGGGTIGVALSWDGGTSSTTLKSTATLSTSDVVYVLGGNTDTWGRSWSPSEFSNANFELIIESDVATQNAVDAIEVRVYHQATGGGGGGGGAI